MPISGKEMAKRFMKIGFEVVKGGGKGSHIKLIKGKVTVIIPGHKELKKGTEAFLLKQLKRNS